MQTSSLLLQNREHFHGKKAVVRKLPTTIYFHNWASRVEKVRGGERISQSLCPPVLPLLLTFFSPQDPPLHPHASP